PPRSRTSLPPRSSSQTPRDRSSRTAQRTPVLKATHSWHPAPAPWPVRRARRPESSLKILPAAFAQKTLTLNLLRLYAPQAAGRPRAPALRPALRSSQVPRSRMTFSLKHKFTSHFSPQHFSDLIPVHSGLVLTRAVTDDFFGHCFKRVRLIADVPGISRHVLKRDL